MSNKDPSVFATSWDNWDHPKRAIAAMLVSTIPMLMATKYLFPIVLNLEIHLALIVISFTGTAFIIAGVIGAIMARFD